MTGHGLFGHGGKPQAQGGAGGVKPLLSHIHALRERARRHFTQTAGALVVAVVVVVVVVFCVGPHDRNHQNQSDTSIFHLHMPSGARRADWPALGVSFLAFPRPRLTNPKNQP